MDAVFKELPAFHKNRAAYLTDEEYRQFQISLMAMPTAGQVIKGAGGLRKIRVGDSRRNKGKRGGLRVIYYWYLDISQFWLFAIYDKDEMTDLTKDQKAALKTKLEIEVRACD